MRVVVGNAEHFGSVEAMRSRISHRDDMARHGGVGVDVDAQFTNRCNWQHQRIVDANWVDWDEIQ